MRKRSKKFAAVFFSLLLVFSVSITAYAADMTDESKFAINSINDITLTGSSATVTVTTNPSYSSIVVGIGCGMPECFNSPEGCWEECFDSWGYCTCMGTRSLSASDIIYSVVSSNTGVATASISPSGIIAISRASGATSGQTAVITVTASFHGYLNGMPYAAAGSLLHSWYDTETFTVTIQ